MRIFIFLAISIVMMSCDPVKRHARLVDRYPYVHRDSIIITIDTVPIYIDSVVTDTLLHIDNIYDTVYIEKDKLRVRTIRVRDSIYIHGECLSDTVYVEVEKKNTITHSEKPKKSYTWAFILLFGTVALAILLRK